MLTVKGLRRPGLEPADLEVAAGECVAMTGASGSGKTLFLRALADLDPSEGRVELDGTPRASMSGPEWRRRVGYLPAESGWWAERVGPHMADPERAIAMSRRLDLPDGCLDWDVARLSTGERQRLALVRLLVNAPRVLLLDEPTSGLDPEAAQRVEALLGDRLDDGVAVVMVTHDGAQARRMARRRFRMAAGRLAPEDPA